MVLSLEAMSGTSPIPPLLNEIEVKYTSAVTLTAEFTQVNQLASLDQKKTSKGRIYVKRPGKVRWETFQPDANILVGNGKKFWFYTPPFDETEHGQVIVRTSEQVQSRLAHALLSGAFSSFGQEMKIKEISPTEFALSPKKGTAGTITKAVLQVDASRKTIKRVTLTHQNGNRSEISLEKIELGPSLGDEMFQFTPPPNTDWIR